MVGKFNLNIRRKVGKSEGGQFGRHPGFATEGSLLWWSVKALLRLASVGISFRCRVLVGVESPSRGCLKSLEWEILVFDASETVKFDRY